MKVLFISSGNSKAGIRPMVLNQGESLKKNGVDLNYFTILGKGTGGYLKNIPRLKKYIRTNDYDLIHAHYSLSSIVASLSSKLPIVVSLMGSDIHMNFFWKIFIKVFYKFLWKATIVKSEKMKRNISLNSAFVIPNGVDFELFKPITKNKAKIKVGFDDKKRHIIFVADPQRPEKNYKLAQKAVELINNNWITLNTISDVNQDMIPYYMNAADVLLFTSLWEGSPNVIKEAMACNCPIVATDVGDIQEVIGTTDGCYICSFDPFDVAEKLKNAIEFGMRTSGRKSIRHLDNEIIAKKIIGLYEKVISSN